MRLRASLATPVFVVTVALAACGGGDDPDPVAVDAPGAGSDGGGTGDAAGAPRETVTRQITLGSGEDVEAEVALVAPGDRVRVRASAPARTLAWNVHTHGSGGTQVLEEANAVDAIDYVIDGASGKYWLLMVNATGDLTVTVDLDLYGGATYNGGL